MDEIQGHNVVTQLSGSFLLLASGFLQGGNLTVTVTHIGEFRIWCTYLLFISLIYASNILWQFYSFRSAFLLDVSDLSTL